MASEAEVTAARFAVCTCLNCCCNLLGQDIIQTDKNMSDLRSEVKKLSAMKRDVQNKVDNRRLESSRVHCWLERSDAMDNEVNKLSDKYDAMCLPRLNLWTRYRISKRASRKLKKTKELIQDRDSLEDTLMMTAASSMKFELQEKQIETMVVGMDPYLEKALQYIDGDAVGVIGICGMGGVGKTTLLRKIHGELLPGKERSKSFDKVVWAVVFKKSIATVDVMHNDIVRLQDDIARELGLDLEKIRDVDDCSEQVLEKRALPIYEYLSNRNFLLLLDDLWSPLELRYIGVPNPTTTNSNFKKHKVVLTSRFKDICGQMQAASGLIDVHCLDDDDAWSLFEFNATKQTITSYPAINNLAREVMSECQGLPLALNIIGKALSTKYGDPWPWTEAREKLRNARHSEIHGMEEENAAMLHRLKISYDYLPSPCEQDCFLSCCLWPEDCSIEKTQLIECWLGLGLISANASSNIDDDIKTGLGIITHLTQAHLLEPGNDDATEVRMHDMIRVMSLWISSDCGNTMNKWLVKAGIGIKTKQRLMELWQGCTPETERVSFMNNLIEELPPVLPRCDRLQVLMLQRNTSLQVVPGPFLLSAPALTYLDLSKTIIKELPAGIGSLHHLQFLNLTESYIEKLPKELSGLAQLRHLLLNGTMLLESVPYGIISRLGQLRILDMFQSRYASWGAGTEGAANDDDDRCACLDEFEARQTFLKWLGITVDSTQALHKLARCHTFSTRRLCLKRMRSPPSLHLLPSNLLEFLGCFDMLQSLEEFLLMSCTSLQEIIIDGGDDDRHEHSGYCLPALEKLELLSLNKLEQIRFQRIPTGNLFPHLRSLKIANCAKLKNVNFALYLPELIHLELQFCPKMVTLIDDTATEHMTSSIIEQGDHAANEIIEQEYHTFPLLKKLTIHMLKSLTSLCSTRISVHFPALQVVEITQCTKLTQLNIRPQGKLREIRGGEEWWQRLQWDEPSIQEQLLPYFRYVRG